MITWLIGENSFEATEALREIKRAFKGEPEQKDGATLTLAELPELLMGLSLFASERLVIITDITQNSQLWEKLPEWLPRVNETIHIVFVDAKPDKRTTSYKALKAGADVREFAVWGERDAAKAEAWVMHHAEAKNAPLTRAQARHLVQRVGLDQWQLANAIETLALLDGVTVEAIDAIIPANPSDSVFTLFELALQGDTQQVATTLRTLALHEEPYKLFALLSSQAVTLATVTFADTSADPAKDFATHPFVVSKLARYAKRMGKGKAARILELFATTDADLKRSKAEPWLLLERTLLRTAELAA